MYKLILVDDESDIRQGIINKVDFESYGFTCVGEAENGVDALDVIEKENPDLAIIDIKMPYMDGIELSDNVHRRFPATSLIILSGFDEFEYAQKAIKYNVIEYVLKPVTSAEIVTLLQRAKKKLDEERNQKRDLQQLKAHFMESMPIIRERFLNALVLQKHSVIDLEHKLERYDIHLGVGDFVVAIVRPDVKDEYTEANELYAYAVYETAKSVCKDDQMTVFLNHAGHTIIIVSISETPEYMHKFEEIRAVIEKKHVHTVTIGLGEIVKAKTYIAESYVGAMISLNYQLLEGDNKVLWIRDLEPNRLDQMIFDIETESELNKVIRSHDIQGVNDLLTEIFKTLKLKKLNIKDVQLFLTELLLSLLKISRHYDVELEWFKAHKNIFKAISSYNDFEELVNIVRTQSELLSRTVQATRKNSIKIMIEKAVDYIHEHYQDISMSLEFVADYLHLSQEYLSRQFKKEMKVTFIQYLSQHRLNKAKQLIEDTNYKNFEVAEAVGYNEANYFSYAFKKQFGISPSQYRKSIQ